MNQITESDLYALYLDNGFDDVMIISCILIQCQQM